MQSIEMLKCREGDYTKCSLILNTCNLQKKSPKKTPIMIVKSQRCIFRLTCSHPELTEDHVFTSAYVKFFRTVTRNAVNKSV